MSAQFPQLSSPFVIGKTTIKNRFAVAPMDPGFDVASDGSFTQMGIDYYVRRAAGGFGLIYTGGMGIDTDFEKFAPSMLDDPAAFVRTGQEIIYSEVFIVHCASSGLDAKLLQGESNARRSGT